MSKQNHEKISAAEARTMLEREGIKITIREAELIVNFLSKVAEILVTNGISKP